MAITYVLTKRLSTPTSPTSSKRWYAQTRSINTVTFDMVAEEAQYSCSATRGDVALVLDACISVMLRHLAQGEDIELGDFGRFHSTLINAKPYYDYQEMAKVIPAPVNKEDFTAAKNIIKSTVRFYPGISLRRMYRTATYRMIEGGTLDTASNQTNEVADGNENTENNVDCKCDGEGSKRKKEKKD